jgi:hypothetical protein
MRAKKQMKELSIQIETNRLRLKAATESKDFDLMLRAQRLVVIAQAEFFDAAKAELGIQTNDCVLVFCSVFPNGEVLDQATYRVLLSVMDYEERETHTAVPIDVEMSEAVQAIVLSMIKGKAS